jgi:hypothetical protein
MNVHEHTGANAIDSRRLEWIFGAVLVVVTIVLTGRWSCATPFAALATLAALTASRRSALLFVGSVWLANQIVGFVFLNYPLDQETIAWGAMLGVSAFLALFAARAVLNRLQSSDAILTASISFAAAFGAYEGSLFAATVLSSSSQEAYVWPVVANILGLNAMVFAILYAGVRALTAAGFIRGIASAGYDFHGLQVRGS